MLRDIDGEFIGAAQNGSARAQVPRIKIETMNDALHLFLVDLPGLLISHVRLLVVIAKEIWIRIKLRKVRTAERGRQQLLGKDDFSAGAGAVAPIEACSHLRKQVPRRDH